MSSFDLAIPVILQHEGGWVNDPADLGAETNWGISTLMIKRLQADRKLASQQMEDMLGIPHNTLYQNNYLKPMPQAKAVEIYKAEFWKSVYNDISNQTVATKIFDFAVNAGHPNSHKRAQMAANDLGQQLTVDSQLGPKSIAAINACGPGFVQAFKKQMENHYEERIQARPQNAKFRNNWFKRAAWGS